MSEAERKLREAWTRWQAIWHSSEEVPWQKWENERDKFSAAASIHLPTVLADLDRLRAGELPEDEATRRLK